MRDSNSPPLDCQSNALARWANTPLSFWRCKDTDFLWTSKLFRYFFFKKAFFILLGSFFAFSSAPFATSFQLLYHFHSPSTRHFPAPFSLQFISKNFLSDTSTDAYLSFFPPSLPISRHFSKVRPQTPRNFSIPETNKKNNAPTFTSQGIWCVFLKYYLKQVFCPLAEARSL